jgi:hypothetical protein
MKVFRRVPLLALSLAGLLLAGCATRVQPSREPYASLSCEELQLVLVQMNDIRSDAQQNQDLTGGAIANNIVFGQLGVLVQKSYNSGSERRASDQMTILYKLWDDRQCSKEIYKKNRASAGVGP